MRKELSIIKTCISLALLIHPPLPAYGADEDSAPKRLASALGSAVAAPLIVAQSAAIVSALGVMTVFSTDKSPKKKLAALAALPKAFSEATPWLLKRSAEANMDKPFSAKSMNAVELYCE